jgi:hypothetical protein
VVLVKSLNSTESSPRVVQGQSPKLMIYERVGRRLSFIRAPLRPDRMCRTLATLKYRETTCCDVCAAVGSWEGTWPAHSNVGSQITNCRGANFKIGTGTPWWDLCTGVFRVFRAGRKPSVGKNGPQARAKGRSSGSWISAPVNTRRKEC